MRVTLKIIVFVVAILAGLSCNTKERAKPEAQEETISVISPEDYKEKSLGKTIIDIRTPEEFNQGHLKGAVNINYFDKDFLDQFEAFDKNKELFIYCRSGNRSGKASPKLVKLGFVEIYDLKGGIKNWINNKNEIEK